MKLILTILLSLSVNFLSHGQFIHTEEFIKKINAYPKDKLESFKKIVKLFTDSLEKSNSSDIDKAFVELLIVQTEIQDNYNKVLWESEDYESLESIMYANEKLHTQKAKEFEKYAEENGFIIQVTEGAIYIEKSPTFLIETFNEFLSSSMKSYLKQYCDELEAPFMEDGGIIINFTTFRQRVLFWDNFDKQNPNFPLPNYPKNQFEFYLYHLLSGADNTPAFDWNSKIILESYLKVYNEIIQENPNTRTAHILKDYTKILKLNAYKKNDELMNFMNKFDPYKY